MGLLLSLLGLAFVIYIFYAGINANNKQYRKNQEIHKNLLDKKINQLEMSIDKQYQFRNEQLIGINEEHQKLIYINNYNDEISVYDYKDILESQIVEDNIQITKTSRSSQIAGALIGGVIAGNVGAMIGGLSGDRIATKKVKTMELHVIVNDINNPIKKIKFLDIGFEVKSNHPDYIKASEEINLWHRIISVMIRQADEQERLKM